MRTLAALLVLLALLASLAAGYCLWTGFVVTASVQTVFQQIALGVAATALFAFALVFLAGAIVAALEHMANEQEMTRRRLEMEYQRRSSGL